MHVRLAVSVLIGATVLAATPAFATSTLIQTGEIADIKLAPQTNPAPVPVSDPSKTEIEVGDTLKYTFNLTTSADSENTSNTYGNVRTFDEKIRDAAGREFEIELKAAAYTATKINGNSYAVDNAHLGLFAEGLGVTTRKDAGGGGGNHQIDNVGSVDFIHLAFGRSVTLTAIERSSFTLYAINNSNQATSSCVNTAPKCAQDNDAAYMATSTTRDQINLALVYAYAFPTYVAKPTTDATDWKTVPSKTPGDIDGKVLLAATSTASSNWLVGGAFNNPDSLKDGFKLKSVQISWNVTAVPEPSTWAMMILGFGFVGCAARRQRRAAAAA